MNLVLDAYRWFLRDRPAGGWGPGGPRPEPPSPEDRSLPALGRADAASAGRIRTALVAPEELARLGRDAEALLGVPVPEDAVVRLVAAELASRAASFPGHPPAARWEVVLTDLLEAGPEEAADVARYLAAPAPWGPLAPPAPVGVPATWAVARLPEGVAFRVRTADDNFLPRAPLPAAYYGTATGFADVDAVEVPEGAAAWRAQLRAFAGEPALWRADAWLRLLARATPIALVLPLVAADADALQAATEGTAVAAPLLATLGERLLAAGEVPRPLSVLGRPLEALAGAERAVRRVLEALEVADEAGLEVLGARDFWTGAVALTSATGRSRVLEPLRRAADRADVAAARGLVRRLRGVGGPAAVSAARDALLAEGRVSPGEWFELTGVR